MKQIAIVICSLILITESFTAQQKLGINTLTPIRALDVNGTGNQYLRVRSTSMVNALSGVEFVRGQNGGFPSIDWRVVNDAGNLKVQYGDNNFATSGSEALRISTAGNTGIGTSSPVSVLHINGGTQLHNGDGYLRLSGISSAYLVFDNNGISARSGNNPFALYIQANGGNTYFGNSGGNTYMVQGGGYVGIGTASPQAPLSIADANFQLYLRNEAGGSINDWYIGASNSNWVVGDNQLVFSPTTSSSDAVFRLKSVTENDGNHAPVMIRTTTDQTILLDGNEIDSRGATLHINHNSQNDTYINPSGGLVGIGTDNPDATLHIVSPAAGSILTLQRNELQWGLDMQIGGNENLLFKGEGIAVGQVNGVNGQWITYSDARRKENVMPLRNVLEDLVALPVFSYSFIHDPDHTRSIGLMAQELQPLFPEIVKEHNGQYGVVYAQLTVLALKAIQEQQQLIDALRSKIAQVKKDRVLQYSHSGSQN